MRRLYELLGVSEDASNDEIKKAYRRLAQRLHPDRNPDDPEAAAKFQEVKEAYECLSDPERRAVYDETGDASLETGSPSEDLFFHLLNEVTEHVESSAEMLEKIRSVLSEMIDECQERKFKADARVLVYQGMIKALRFKGKGTNFIEGVLNDKLKKLKSDRDELDQATTAAKGAYDLLGDYEATDLPPSMGYGEFGETPESLRVKTIEGLLRSAYGGGGRRRGGMPFSGV